MSVPRYSKPPRPPGLPGTFQRAVVPSPKCSVVNSRLNCCALTYSPQLSPLMTTRTKFALGAGRYCPATCM